jgi:hypothetical protein
MMRRRGRRAMERGRTDTTISDDLAGSQARDLLGTEPQFAQDCHGILPPLRRSCTQRIGMSTQRERLTHQMNGAKHGVLYRLGHPQMLHLWIVEYLIDSVNGPAGDTGLIEEGNQLLTGVALGIRLYGRVERITMLRARGAVRIARVT